MSCSSRPVSCFTVVLDLYQRKVEQGLLNNEPLVVGSWCGEDIISTRNKESLLKVGIATPS